MCEWSVRSIPLRGGGPRLRTRVSFVLTIVRRPQVRELVQQIAVRPNLVFCHLAVCVDRQEDIDNIVGEFPAIVRKPHRLMRVIRKNVWQQLSGDSCRVLRGIAACVFQFVCEDANEAIIIRWLSAEVRFSFLSNKENRLHWSSTPLDLDPAFSIFNQYATPNS